MLLLSEQQRLVEESENSALKKCKYNFENNICF